MIIEYIIFTLLLVCVGIVMLGPLVAIYIVIKMLADEVIRRDNK